MGEILSPLVLARQQLSYSQCYLKTCLSSLSCHLRALGEQMALNTCTLNLHIQKSRYLFKQTPKGMQAQWGIETELAGIYKYFFYCLVKGLPWCNTNFASHHTGYPPKFDQTVSESIEYTGKIGRLHRYITHDNTGGYRGRWPESGVAVGFTLENRLRPWHLRFMEYEVFTVGLQTHPTTQIYGPMAGLGSKWGGYSLTSTGGLGEGMVWYGK